MVATSDRLLTPRTSGERPASRARVRSCSRDVTGRSPSQVSRTAGRPRRLAEVTGVSPIGTTRPTSPETSPRTSPPQVSVAVAPLLAPRRSRRRSPAPGGPPVRPFRGSATPAPPLVLARHHCYEPALSSHTCAERSVAWRLVVGLGGCACERIVGRGGRGRWAGWGHGRDGEGREGRAVGRDRGWWGGGIGRVQVVAKRSVDTCHPFGEAAPASATPPPAAAALHGSRGC